MTALALVQHVHGAGVLHAIRDAVVAILVIVFVLGALVGFVIGRAVGRRR